MKSGQFKSFVKWGGIGGKKRARRLSTAARSSIALRAARARWEQATPNKPGLESLRLNNPQLTDPTYIEEILGDGTLEEWKPLFDEVINHPFGQTAMSLHRVLASSRLYGITPLWRGLLCAAQGCSGNEDKTA